MVFEPVYPAFISPAGKESLHNPMTSSGLLRICPRPVRRRSSSFSSDAFNCKSSTISWFSNVLNDVELAGWSVSYKNVYIDQSVIDFMPRIWYNKNEIFHPLCGEKGDIAPAQTEFPDELRSFR